jgi:hypothetical protein
MNARKPERPWLTPNEALKALVPLVEEYLAAAKDHYDADFFADSEAAVEANARGEKAYSDLVLGLEDARRTLNDQL